MKKFIFLLILVSFCGGAETSDSISTTNDTDACIVYEQEMIEVRNLVENFVSQTISVINGEVVIDEYLLQTEADYYLLMATYFGQVDLEPPSVYKEAHQYRLREIENYILAYEWWLKSIEELNQDYADMSLTYLNDGLDDAELISSLNISC